MKEYLVEIETISRMWIEANNEKDAISIAENNIENDYSEIKDIQILDSRQVENDDDYLIYLDDEDLDERW